MIEKDVKNWKQSKSFGKTLATCKRNSIEKRNEFTCRRGFYVLIGEWIQSEAHIKDVEFKAHLGLIDLINTPHSKAFWLNLDTDRQKIGVLTFDECIREPLHVEFFQTKKIWVGDTLSCLAYFEKNGVGFTILFTDNNFCTLLDIEFFTPTKPAN